MASDLRYFYFAQMLFVLIHAGCWQSVGEDAPLPRETTASEATSFPLQAKLDLGVIVQGKSAALACWMTNRGKTPLRVAKIESSCDCLTVTLSRNRIAQGERILVSAAYDGAKESHFTGSLLIEVDLLDERQSIIGRLEFPIEVIRADVSSTGGDL